MRNKNDIMDKEYERIKSFIDKFSYVDLIIWRNEMIENGEIYNRVFELFNQEILKRAAENGKLNNNRKTK